MRNASPTCTPSPGSGICDSSAPISSKRVVPSSPYIWLMPYSIRADENAPSRMYLVPASLDLGL